MLTYYILFVTILVISNNICVVFSKLGGVSTQSGIFNYRFVHSSELQKASSVVRGYFNSVDNNSDALVELLTSHGVEDLSYGEFYVLNMSKTPNYFKYFHMWTSLSDRNIRQFITADEYYSLLGTFNSPIYQIKRADITNRGEDMIVYTHYDQGSSSHSFTEVWRWCDDESLYLRWFSLIGTHEVLNIGNSYFLFRSCHFRGQKLLYLDGLEARGMTVGRGAGATFSDLS
ncbi:MAG: hypothetical protein LBH62_09670, partial [Nitrososphaerota archaeon]|nr:hypothetical protein [Nitrososphaerota archaeon]